MRLGEVIGKVTLGHAHRGLAGARWLLVSPLDRRQMASGEGRPLSPLPTLVCYDHLGAGAGDIVGYVEGREAAEPFEPPIPIDAYIFGIVDRIHFQDNS